MNQVNQKFRLLSLKGIEADILSKEGISVRNQMIYFFFLLASVATTFTVGLVAKGSWISNVNNLTRYMSVAISIYFCFKLYDQVKRYPVKETFSNLAGLIFVCRIRVSLLFQFPVMIIMSFLRRYIAEDMIHTDYIILYSSFLRIIAPLIVYVMVFRIYRRIVFIQTETHKFDYRA